MLVRCVKKVCVMSIVGKGDAVYVEYEIPQEIDSKIPEYFYFAMAGELCSIYGPHIFDKVEYAEYDEEGNELPVDDNEVNLICEPSDDGALCYYNLDSGTGGWYEAFKATCRKLNMEWLFDYWKTLEWYDSDIFDGIIENRIVEKFVKCEDHHCNVYYQWLCSHKD